eukprot:1303574-Pyramimonas_sp.AAC.1
MVRGALCLVTDLQQQPRARPGGQYSRAAAGSSLPPEGQSQDRVRRVRRRRQRRRGLAGGRRRGLRGD